mmetsp:Transcript_6097/g.17837  ORF Transcript_6097/g.17837 Transcript_6097/m.17837 type:complete len:240 (+) Transcript_6097:697-1416(+)
MPGTNPAPQQLDAMEAAMDAGPLRLMLADDASSISSSTAVAAADLGVLREVMCFTAAETASAAGSPIPWQNVVVLGLFLLPSILTLASVARLLVGPVISGWPLRSKLSRASSNWEFTSWPNGMLEEPGTGIRWAVRSWTALMARVADSASSLPPPTMAPSVPPSTQKSRSTLRSESKTGLVAIRSLVKSGPEARLEMQPTDERRVNTPYLYPLPPRPLRVLCSKETILGMTFSVFLSRS